MLTALDGCKRRYWAILAVLHHYASYAKRRTTKNGKRTKRSIKSISLTSLGWKSEHEATFLGLQKTLCHHVKLAHRRPHLTLCIYTDASEKLWAGIVTQCEPSELSRTDPDQCHQLLSFSGKFTKTELGWTTFEKRDMPSLRCLPGSTTCYNANHSYESLRTTEIFSSFSVCLFSTHHSATIS